MNRRRFVPSIDGLEVREMLSTTAATAQVAKTTTPAQNPVVETLRAQRIERLPVLLFKVSRDRVVPPQLVAALQDDLRLIENRLLPPSTTVLNNFNLEMRSILSHGSLSPETVGRLNNSFSAILRSSNAPEPVIAQFVNDLTQLARIDSFSRNPATVGANDYALMAQLCMGIGISSLK